jgi:hypothetical protein
MNVPPPTPRLRQPHREPTRQRPMTWGLSLRLPRWRTFDGRRSRVAASWATPVPDGTVRDSVD